MSVYNEFIYRKGVWDMKTLLSRRMLLILSLLAVILFSFVTFQLKMIPLKFFIPMVICLFVVVYLLYKGEKDKKKEHPLRVTLLKLMNIILSIVLIFVSLKVMKGNNMLAAITGGGEQTIEMNVVVLNNSSYKVLKDLEGKIFGGNTTIADDALNINKAQAIIEDEIDEIDFYSYDTYDQLIVALEKTSIDAIIIKSIDIDSLDDIEDGFSDKIRIIKQIDIKIPGVKANSAKVTQEPFHVLISGTDKEGPIDTFALSDVNLLATINPTTKQVLLVSIPRDYYVDIIGMDGVSGKDKLTHSAKGGMKCTQETVENLFGIQVNYYAKFNFTSFMNVIDALGGITVDVPQYAVKERDDGIFTTTKGHYTIEPGINNFDAKEALCFVRERKAFVKGDEIRGKNQMLVLKAIIKKCCSPSVITKLDGIFDSLASSFETNMSAKDIQSLINMQISDMASWDIQSYRVTGDASQRTKILATVGDVTKSNPNGLYINVPNEETIAQAKEYIQDIKDNKIVKVKE